MFIYKFRGKRLICKKKQTNKQTNKNNVGGKHKYIFSTCIARRYDFEF
jgi:hypothetical protein